MPSHDTLSLGSLGIGGPPGGFPRGWTCSWGNTLTEDFFGNLQSPLFQAGTTHSARCVAANSTTIGQWTSPLPAGRWIFVRGESAEWVRAASWAPLPPQACVCKDWLERGKFARRRGGGYAAGKGGSISPPLASGESGGFVLAPGPAFRAASRFPLVRSSSSLESYHLKPRGVFIDLIAASTNPLIIHMHAHTSENSNHRFCAKLLGY